MRANRAMRAYARRDAGSHGKSLSFQALLVYMVAFRMPLLRRRRKPSEGSKDGFVSTFREMEPELRGSISTVLVEVVDQLNGLIQAMFRDGPSNDNCRAFLISATERPEVVSMGEAPNDSAIRGILFATLAGMDHARLFAVALASDHPTFGLATLTRGAIEAYGRAWWFLQSSDETELLVRWLSAMSKELSMATRVDPSAVLAELRGFGTSAELQQQAVLGRVS